MRLIRCVTLGVVLCLGITVPASASIVLTETFDVDLGTFDAAVGNTSGGNNYGFSNTTNAGGSAGEIGGTFSQQTNAYVADTTLGGVVGWNDPLVIQAKGLSINGGNDQVAVLGYFNATGQPADGARGNMMAGVGFTGGGPRMYLLLDGVLTNVVGVPNNTPFDIDLALTYNAGTNTATWSGTVAGNVVSDSRVVGNFARTVNAFGVTSGYASGAAFSTDSFFDDIQYSARSDAPVVAGETFDTAHGALAEGWLAMNDGVQSNIVGFSNTNDAGGAAAGEGQGHLRRSSVKAHYADMALGGEVSTGSGFAASGKLDVTSVGSPDFGAGAYLGYFNPIDDSRFGVIFNNSGANLTWGLRIVTPANSIIAATGLDGGHVISPNTDRTFAFTWDPDNGNGQLTGWISGAGAAQTINLTAGQRAALDAAGFSLRAFGLNLPSGGSSSPGNNADFRIDEVSYTAAAIRPTATEPFDTGGGAAANGWTVVNNDAGATVGFSPTANAGGPAGEARATWRRSDLAYYADTSVADFEPIDFSTPFEAWGALAVEDVQVSTGNGSYIGFFDAANINAGNVDELDVVGLMFDEGLAQARLFHRTGGVNEVFKTQTFASGLSGDLDGLTFMMDYDPAGGVNGQGRLTVFLGGPGINDNTEVIDLTAAERALLSSVSLNAFGLLKPAAGGSAGFITLYADNLTYTKAVPEPASLVLWGLGAAGLACCVRRRRRR